MIGYVLAIEGGWSGGSYPGRESRRGRGFGERWTERSDRELETPTFNICIEFRASSRAWFWLYVPTGGRPKS